MKEENNLIQCHKSTHWDKGGTIIWKTFFLTLHLPGRGRGRRGLTKHFMSPFPYKSPLPDYTTVSTLLIKNKEYIISMSLILSLNFTMVGFNFSGSQRHPFLQSYCCKTASPSSKWKESWKCRDEIFNNITWSISTQEPHHWQSNANS